MREEIIRVIDEKRVHGMLFQVVETKYEFGRHYVFMINGQPGFNSTDLERVENYMNSIAR